MRKVIDRREYRFAYPEFLPDPEPKFRDRLREKLERRDMLARRNNVDFPEFYVGSIIAVTVADQNAEGKTSRFMGIVIDRGGCGLRAWAIIRNVIDNQGVEIMYQLYSPTIKEIEVLRLEKRLDDNLYYLRDSPLQYSTFPTDMLPEVLPEGEPVPVNELVVPLGPEPWFRRWERYTDRLFGYSFSFDNVRDKLKKKAEKHNLFMNQGWQMQVYKYDLMRDYRFAIPLEEQDAIWADVGPTLERREAELKRAAAKKNLALSTKASSTRQ